VHLQDAPVADAKPDDIKDLLGGALFKALYKWMEQEGPIYLLPTGPVSSFLVICDPAAAKHVLQLSDNPKNNVYSKGLVAEVSEFLFGLGFATACVSPSPDILSDPVAMNKCMQHLLHLAME
jgi:carotenoid epsilon hydroxylase